MKHSIFSVAIVALLAVTGCDRYAMKDIKIVNANEHLGYDVVTVCDTCKEHGACGNRNDSLVWADQHSRTTGHTHFTRQACSTGLTPVIRGPEEHVAPKLDAGSDTATKPWTNEDVLKTGMTIADARIAIGDVGRTDSETMVDSVARRTIRFRQAGHGASAGFTRTVLADFENGKLTASKYGEWEK